MKRVRAEKRVETPPIGTTGIRAALATAFQKYERGDIEAAAKTCRRILANDSRQPQALHLLGSIALQTNRHDVAERLFNQLIGAAPNGPLGPAGLGVLRLCQNKLDEAVALLRRSLALAPEQPDVQNNLGLAYLRLGDRSAAETHFHKALEHFPDYADAHLNLGKLLYDNGLFEAAAEHYQQAITISPEMAEAHNNLGNVHRRLGNLDTALACYRSALNADPGFIEARYNAGVSKLEQGRFAGALAEFEKVVSTDRGHVKAIARTGEVLEALGRAEEASAWYGKAADLCVDRSLPWTERRARHFALGRIHDRLGNYDTAFTHFKAANDLWLEHLRRSGGAYDANVQEQMIDAIIAAFPLTNVAEHDAIGNMSRRPVFVLGMPRSGTTLVEQILASHPQVHGAGELPDIPRMAMSMASDGFWADAVGALDADRAGALAAGYLDKLRRIDPTASSVVNKLPMNFLYLGLIRTLFPATPIIHCRRDSLDICISNYLEYFAEPKPFTNDLVDLGHFFGQYERLMAHWDKAFPGTIFHLDYEMLIDDQEGVSRALIEHCGLEWDRKCLSFHKTERPIQTASLLQVRRPIYRSSIQRWRNYDRHLGALKAALGYGRNTE
ncbi:MAG: sulfotransferase [Proteobacteria bacterium]|nr:sulfotransferase [Pseudomonadota bacterium]